MTLSLNRKINLFNSIVWMLCAILISFMAVLASGSFIQGVIVFGLYMLVGKIWLVIDGLDKIYEHIKEVDERRRRWNIRK